MIADSELIRMFHPKMAPLLKPYNAPPGWKPVSEVQTEGGIIYVYERESM